MGMSGHVCITAKTGTGNYNYLLDSTFAPILNWAHYDPHFDVFCAINKDRKVWYGTYDNTGLKFTVLSTSGSILSQFSMPGNYILKEMVADTSGHIYVVYDNGTSSGFGVMRFGSSYVPDFQKWVSIPASMQSVKWGIDQRLYVQFTTQICVLDAQGNVLKWINTLYPDMTIYQDHGFAITTTQADSISVVRLDSNMTLRWAKKFKPGAPFNLPYSISRRNTIAMPGSDDLAVIVSVLMNVPWWCSGSTSSSDLRLVTLDKNGAVVSSGTMAIDDHHVTAKSTPFGDPLVMTMSPFCITAATAHRLGVRVLPVYDTRPSCSGVSQSYPSVSFMPLGLPSIGTGPGSVSTPVALVPTTMNIAILGAVSNGHSYICRKPCLTVNPQPLGGGLVAFNDEIYGYYSLLYSFGDGTTGTTADPTHQYPGTGTYPLTVIATNGCGSDTITIPFNPCVTPQIVGPTSACGTGTVTFHEGSGLAQDSLTWLVNGIAITTNDSMVWTPPAIGAYQIALIYRDGICRDTSTLSFSTNIGLPVPAFSYAMVPTRTVNCTNLSSNALSYAWTFGDGGTSSLLDPSHNYNGAGPYQICLTATNGCGSVQTCQTMPCPFPQAIFSITQNGNVIAINNTSTGATTYTWDFGDGQTATGPVTSHTYTNGGTYNLCLTASNACMSISFCRTVTIVSLTAANYYRIGYPAIGSSPIVTAVANHGSQSMVIGQHGSSTRFLMIVDSLGTTIAAKTLNSSYTLRDVVAMPNGNFLVVGDANTFMTSTLTNGLWMEVNPIGTILSATVLGGPQAEYFESVKPARSGGFIITGSRSDNTGFYVKLDANLQVQWKKSVATIPIAGFEAPDNTIWLVEMLQSSTQMLRFVHLDANGTDLDEYQLQLTTATSSPSVFAQNLNAQMACDGTIYVSAGYIELTPTRKKLLLARFNTSTHQGRAMNYRLTGAPNGASPYYDANINALLLLKNDSIRVLGSMNLQGSSGTVPGEDLFVADIDPNTLAVTAMYAYGTNTKERYDAACVLETGAQLAARTDQFNGLKLHKFAQPSQVQLAPSTYTPHLSITDSTSALTYYPAVTYPSANYGNTASGLPVSAPLTVSGLVQDQMPCASTVTASFTYTILGNVAHLTSTSTPSANLAWTVAGQTCLTGPSITVPLSCNNPVTVTLRAFDDCRSSTFSQVISLPGTAASLGPDRTVCAGLSATFTPGPGFSSYSWSNGSTSSSITVTTPGSYAVTVTNSSGCSSSDTANLSNFVNPVGSIGPNQTVCAGANATFTASAGFASYLWSNGATTNAITTTTIGAVSVTATDANGCTATAWATLSNFPSASFSIGPDTSFCPDTTWQLSGPSGGTYLWSTNATSQSIAAGTAGTYSLQYTDANGCSASDTINLALSADCVWPGDANHDGVADNQDLLAVGYGFGFMGTTRPNASPSWYGQPAPNWTTALPSLVNHKHPDCDGNGTIDYMDTTLIAANYGFTHNKNTGATAGIPLYVVPEQDSFPAGDTVFFTLRFGDANNLAIGAHGLAFSFHIDPQQITSGTLYARYSTSFLGNVPQDLLTLTYPEQGSGNWHIGISRKDRIGQNGMGTIMRVGFLPDQVYPLTSTLGFVPVRLLNPVGVDGDFDPILVSAIDDSIFIYDPVNATAQPRGLLAWNLYPIPVAGTAVLEISLSAEVQVEASLVDMHGRVLRGLLKEDGLNLGSNKILIETEELAQGIYFVRLVVDGRTMVKKLVVER